MSSFLTAHLGKRRYLLTDPLDMSPMECVNLAVTCIGEGSAARITPLSCRPAGHNDHVMRSSISQA